MSAPRLSLNQHIHTTSSGLDRYQEQGLCNILREPPEGTPQRGLGRVPFTVYKNCPLLLKWLWNILKVIWRTRRKPFEYRTKDFLRHCSKEADRLPLPQWLHQHKLGQTGMTRCHVAEQVVGLVMDNYNQFRTSLSSSVTSDW